MPNVYFGPVLERELEAFKEEVLAERPWCHQEWTQSAMVKLLLHAGLEACRAAPLSSAVICAPFQLPLGGQEPHVISAGAPWVSLEVPLAPYPSFQLRGLLYEELGGDAEPVARGLRAGAREQTGFQTGVELTGLTDGVLDLRMEVRYPERLRIEVSAREGRAARVREARSFPDQVAFRLHALIRPLPPSPGVSP